jgi:hypothetical protein
MRSNGWIGFIEPWLELSVGWMVSVKGQVDLMREFVLRRDAHASNAWTRLRIGWLSSEMLHRPVRSIAYASRQKLKAVECR